MGRTVRQKRKSRSSRPVVRTDNRRKKQLNPMGNSIVAQNWNKNETLTQNYRRLGLVTRLQRAAGGVEPLVHGSHAQGRPKKLQNVDPLGQPAGGSGSGIVREVRVERDADGRIVRVLDGKSGRDNPLGDPLRALDSDSGSDADGDKNNGEKEEEEWAGLDDARDGEDEEEDESRPAVIRALERQARQPVLKGPRHQSAGERQWLLDLVARHGDDTEAMARDRRLNPMQQTAADIAGRIRRLGNGAAIS